MSGLLHLPPTGLPRIPRYTGVAEHLVDSLARLNPLSVLRGPRGFGKTSLLVSWLRRDGDLPETLYLSLTPEAGEAEGFWSHLRSGLAQVDPTLEPAPQSPNQGSAAEPSALSEATGHPEVTDTVGTPHAVDTPRTRDERETPAGADHEHAVRSWLSRRRSPLLLLIDDYHEAGLRSGAAGIDDALLDLIRENDQLYLVIAGRTVRALETIGALSVETLVIGPEELQLTPSMVQALAAELGVDLTTERTRKIAADLGGWPSAIRAGLQRAASGSAYGTGEVTLGNDYIAAMVQDLRFETVRTFLLRTSVPSDFDIETARIIAPEGNTVRMLRNIRAAGLLRESETTAGTYYYPRAIRSALRAVLRETRPGEEQQVYEDLMRAAIGRNDPAQALVYATKGRLWGLALDLVDTQWSYLLSASPAALGRAATLFPRQMLAENARLSVAAKYFKDLPNEDGAPIWAGVDSASLNAALALHRGRQVDAGQDELLLLMQWGAGSLLAGNLDLAMYAFSQARSAALLNGDHSESYLGAAGIALVHALQGEVDQCLNWLEETNLVQWLEQGRLASGADPMMLVAAAARALALVDGARPGADEAVVNLADPDYRDELWALCVFIRARHTMATGHTAEIVRQTSIVRTALRHIRSGSLLEALLTTALVDSLLSSNMVVVAAEVVHRLAPRGFTWVAVAKLRLHQNRFEEAVEAAEAALNSSGESGRYVLEAHAVLAAAHRAAGRAQRARQAFEAAMHRSQQTGQRRGIDLMGRGLFLTYCAEEKALLTLWPDGNESAEALAEVDPESVTLTLREAEILQCLTRYSGPMGIAENLGLSVNTVKTHLRSVYRKLGVSNRNDALAKVQRVIVRT